MSADAIAGIVLVLIGIALFAFEFIHPGIFLMIPASVLVAGGILYALLPDWLTNSFVGAAIIVIVAVVAAFVTIPYYRWVAPVHPPMTATPISLVGQTGVVLTSVVPNSLKGKVRIQSQVWSARARTPIPAGTMVQVISGEGVSVEVRALDPNAPGVPA